MGFVDAVKSAYSNYVNFKGRASRSEFWWFYLFYMIAYIGLSAMGGASEIFVYLAAAFSLVSLLPFLGLAVRRVHDGDKSGWFILIPLYNLYLYIIKGTDGPNRFGDDPVG